MPVILFVVIATLTAVVGEFIKAWIRSLLT